MEDREKRLIEKYDADFHKLASKEGWTKDDIAMMKDLQKLMYYMEVRCAMKDGEEYPGSEYMPEKGMSYARGNMDQARNMNTGRYMSRGSGHYPMGSNGPWYYDDMRGSGRRYYDGRYYDGEKEDAVHKLHKVMDSETNPEFKAAIQTAIHELEAR